MTAGDRWSDVFIIKKNTIQVDVHLSSVYVTLRAANESVGECGQCSISSMSLVLVLYAVSVASAV